MSYKLYTPRNLAQQDAHQWSNRDLLDEVEVCDYRTNAEHFRRYLPPAGKMVEAGCGLGGWVRYLRDRGYDAIGIDRDPNVVRRAREADPTLPIEEGEVARLPFADGELAAWISLGVIEHFEEGPAVALAEAFRVLKPGGRALIAVPALSMGRRLFVHPLRSTVLALMRLGGRRMYFGEYRYSLAELLRFITDAGFRIVATDYDEIVPGDHRRHIGVYADFPFLRACGKAWELNALGRGVARIARALGPAAFVNGWFVIAEKPS